jgi:hypothetical protein
VDRDRAIRHARESGHPRRFTPTTDLVEFITDLDRLTHREFKDD